jgi:hypothetical protein
MAMLTESREAMNLRNNLRNRRKYLQLHPSLSLPQLNANPFLR